MTFAAIGLAAFLASALTVYSGFGLGTILLAVFSLFFPVSAAVAMTAVVHLLNNLFKGGLLWRQVDWPIVARVGLPAIPAAIAGAGLLACLGSRLFEWEAFGRLHGPTLAGLTIGALMILLAGLELQPRFQRLAAPPRILPLGGLLTGFFGGLTGQQGALRSVFLLRAGLEPKRFIATGVLVAVLVDLSRIPAYAVGIDWGAAIAGRGQLMIYASLCAFAGALVGTRYLGKATIGTVRAFVAGLLFVIGVALIAGVLGT